MVVGFGSFWLLPFDICISQQQQQQHNNNNNNLKNLSVTDFVCV